jgi:hypothetical protein
MMPPSFFAMRYTQLRVARSNGMFLAVAEKEILAEVFAEALEEVAQMADQRKIPQHGVLFLRHVLHVKVDQRPDDERASSDSQATSSRSSICAPLVLEFYRSPPSVREFS